MKKTFLILLTIILSAPVLAQTIAEKKAGLSGSGSNSDLSHEMQTFLMQVNQELQESEDELRQLYQKVGLLYESNAPDQAYCELLKKINELKSHIEILENSWREIVSNGQEGQEEYALWHQPETTVGQLVMDYGSQSYVYLMSPEIAEIRLSVNSNLPIPRSSWNEMLELILEQNGVGIKQLNPFLRQLYLLKEDRSGLQIITDNRDDLYLFPGEARVAFVLSPEPAEVKRVWVFLEKFVNPQTTVLQMIGRDILLVGSANEILELLKLYDFVALNKGEKEFRIVTLKRVDSEEMAKILNAIFDQFMEETPTRDTAERNARRPAPGAPNAPIMRPPRIAEKRNDDFQGNINGLRVIPLSHIAQALFLIGTQEEILKAEEIIREVENQVGDVREKIVYWYNTRHSDPEELAKVLEKVYNLMIAESPNLQNNVDNPPLPTLPFQPPAALAPDGRPVPLLDVAPPPLIPVERRQAGYIGQPFPLRNIFDPGFYLDDRYKVDPRARNDARNHDPNLNRENFIVDPKTGSIVMVVEAYILPKLKDLIAKLDVPKKMVQLEVLLFEKKILNQNNFGLNLLKIGSDASNTNRGGFNFIDFITPENTIIGITQFFLSRKKTDSGIPAFDLVYNFLLTREDIQINASPSVLTMNQTPARIEIAEEISVDTGIYEIPATGSNALKRSFARARYGIKIEITPTIHMMSEHETPDCHDEENYVTLVTDINFETIQPSATADRPPVTSRMITNEVRIPDGQTVILGGLRRKNTNDKQDTIPFIGELPGIGKLFSSTLSQDSSTEMFIFITPKIISDPGEDLEKLRQAEMTRRPGDIPEFLCSLVEAREIEKHRLMKGSMQMLFGREPERCYYPIPEGEYDGRGCP